MMFALRSAPRAWALPLTGTVLVLLAACGSGAEAPAPAPATPASAAPPAGADRAVPGQSENPDFVTCLQDNGVDAELGEAPAGPAGQPAEPPSGQPAAPQDLDPANLPAPEGVDQETWESAIEACAEYLPGGGS